MVKLGWECRESEKCSNLKLQNCVIEWSSKGGKAPVCIYHIHFSFFVHIFFCFWPVILIFQNAYLTFIQACTHFRITYCLWICKMIQKGFDLSVIMLFFGGETLFSCFFYITSCSQPNCLCAFFPVWSFVVHQVPARQSSLVLLGAPGALSKKLSLWGLGSVLILLCQPQTCK